MKSNERAKWLNFSREDIYPEKTGKKKFVKHKNMHTPVFLAQQENFSNKKVELPSIKKKLIPSSSTNQKIEKKIQAGNFSYFELEKKLKEKDSEIKILQNLYSHVSNRLQKLSDGSLKDNIGLGIRTPEPRLNSDYNIEQKASQSISNMKRNLSGSKTKNNSFLEYAAHPAFLQPKYTKNRPKILITNPITGVVPFY